MAFVLPMGNFFASFPTCRHFRLSRCSYFVTHHVRLATGAIAWLSQVGLWNPQGSKQEPLQTQTILGQINNEISMK